MRMLVFPSRSGAYPFLLVGATPGVDGGWRCFFSPHVNAWVIVQSSDLAPHLEVDGETMTLQADTYNGEPAWLDGHLGAVFKSVTGDWIYNPSGLFEPQAELDVDGTTWLGDGWWLLSSAPCKATPRPAATARGTMIGQGTAPVLVWVWPRWEMLLPSQDEHAPFAGRYVRQDRSDGYSLFIVDAPSGRPMRAWHAEVALWR